MKKLLILLTALALALCLYGELAGQERRNAINSCPIAPVFGIISVNYEHMFGRGHGLVTRLDYEAIPDTYSDAHIESSAKALILNYRWHVSDSMASLFLGVYTRYRRFAGTGTSGASEFDFTMPELTVGLNVGKRWVMTNGFDVTFALGYGVSDVSRNVDASTAFIESALSVFEDEYPFFNPAYGELSVGYVF